MTDLAATDELFFTRARLDRGRVQSIVDDALKGTDDGELFLEYRQRSLQVTVVLSLLRFYHIRKQK